MSIRKNTPIFITTLISVTICYGVKARSKARYADIIKIINYHRIKKNVRFCYSHRFAEPVKQVWKNYILKYFNLFQVRYTFVIVHCFSVSRGFIPLFSK